MEKNPFKKSDGGCCFISYFIMAIGLNLLYGFLYIYVIYY